MACSGSLTVINDTGFPLTASNVKKLNDDAKFSGVANGDILNNEQQLVIVMSNNSVVIAPRGVGVEVTFTSENKEMSATLHLDIPAVGSHTLSSRDVTGVVVNKNWPQF